MSRRGYSRVQFLWDYGVIRALVTKTLVQDLKNRSTAKLAYAELVGKPLEAWNISRAS